MTRQIKTNWQTNLLVVVATLAFLFVMPAPLAAQQTDQTNNPSPSLTPNMALAESTENNSVAETKEDSDYSLRRGTNEFGVWSSGAFFATPAFGGMKADEASGRKTALLAFRYGRTLAANKSLAFQYTVDFIPIIVETGNIVEDKVIAAAKTGTTFRRKTAYGAGITPFGLQVDFKNSSHIKPFVHINIGALIFNKPVPLPDAGNFAFTLESGAGVRIFTEHKRAVTLGVRFHHISNADLSGGSNRGKNVFAFYIGFSVFK